ncbi:MAG: PAS domain-containing protein, partial [Spirochaetales bacterium]|nr:PAS domain-containing protein [Spirochaetales bacterium]
IDQSCYKLVCTTKEGNCPADESKEGLEHSERALLHADGHLIDVEKTVTKILLEDRQVYLETLIDITERIAAEKHLRELSQIQSSILNNSTLGIALVENRKYKWVNSRLCELFGQTPEEMQGEYTRIMYASDADYEKMGEIIYETLKNNLRFDHALRVKKHNGELFWCRLIGKALDPSRPLDGGSLWMIEDITERRETEENLIRLSTAIEQSPEAIVITDTEGNIQYINPAFEKTTGYTEKEALGQTPRILKSEEHPASFYKNLWNTISSGNVWEGRFINKCKNGSLFTEEASIAPVKDSDGQIVNYVAVKRDITEELTREEELHHAQKI